ncbi:MAG: chemotaxis-specific protein-glutamate methyltransferase CheB [Thermoanaerobaculia bacterium]|nr:chemotaxis-specific protein-glutamate methyltransferase CheB [Thermoanaerobaculia bacterium]
MKRVRVAIVDDSTFIRKAMARMLGDHPKIRIVGVAGSGEELLAHLDDWSPDVVTLDLDMPGIGGLATLDRLLSQRPTPVIVLSTHSGKGAPLTIEALHRGATDFIDKQSYSLVDFGSLRAVLLEKIFHVTGVSPTGEVLESEAPAEPSPRSELEPVDEAPAHTRRYDIIALGASTGGPPTIQQILEDLGETTAVPVVVVQHMPVGFTHAFAERLNAHLPLHVSEAKPMERLLRGSVYIAPAGSHLRIVRSEGHLYSEISIFGGDYPHVPSIDVLFHSIAKTVGSRAVAALLTGMGHDGAQGLLALKKQGSYTLVQDEASCVVFGMPRVALSLGAAREVAALDQLGPRIRELINRRLEDDP